MDYTGNVLVIVENLPVPFDRRVWLESLALTEGGNNVFVICPKAPHYEESYEELDGVRIFRYHVPIDARSAAGFLFEFLYCFFMSFALALKIYLRYGFDVIHACNPPETFFIIGLFFKLFGVRFVFDHHDLSPEMYRAKYDRGKDFFYKILVLFERMTFKTSDYVISTNESYKHVAITRGRVKPEKITVVRSGPDFDRLKIYPTEENLKEGRRFLVCYLGEICKQDGLDYFMRSINFIVHKCNRNDILFVIMGGGPYLSEIRDLAKSLDLMEYVQFTGRIPDEGLCRYLSSADVCVACDPYTEWADKSTMNKVLEYMTFAKPIVSFDLKETQFSADGAAVYVQPNNEEAFGEAILNVLGSKKKREEMGKIGRKRIINELSWDYSKKSFIELYRKIFQENKQ